MRALPKMQPRCKTCQFFTHDCHDPREGRCAMQPALETYAPAGLVAGTDPSCSQYAPSKAELARIRRNAKARIGRAIYADAMDACGLTRVRSDSGRIYWE